MTDVSTADDICGRCGNAAPHLFPADRSPIRICSHCYAAQRLHAQGSRLTWIGVLAIALGAAVLVAIVILLLTT